MSKKSSSSPKSNKTNIKKSTKKKEKLEIELTDPVEENALNTWLPIGVCLGVTFGCCFSVVNQGNWEHFTDFLVGGLLFGILAAAIETERKKKAKKTKKKTKK